MTKGEAEGHAPELPRRRFLDWLLGTSIGGLLAAVFYPVSRYVVPPPQPESTVSSVVLPMVTTDLAPNSGKIFKFGNKPGILIRTPTGQLRAFSAVCTHLGCTVQYRDDLEHIWCACHNGHYNLAGQNISGPPPRPLPAYDVRVSGDQVVVSRPA
jgi:Rieske Fe-S protein